MNVATRKADRGFTSVSVYSSDADCVFMDMYGYGGLAERQTQATVLRLESGCFSFLMAAY